MSDFDFSDAPKKPGRRPGPYSAERTPFQWGFGIGCGIIAAVVAVNLVILLILFATGAILHAGR